MTNVLSVVHETRASEAVTVYKLESEAKVH